PASGLSTGGESIDITGSGFSGGTQPTVTLGGTAATQVSVASDTKLTVTTPAHAPGAVDVTVSRDGGTGTKAGAYTYNQGYWLTVTNSQPPGTGASTEKSTGAVRTSALGAWSGTSTDKRGFGFTRTEYWGYHGGIYCGNRMVRSSLFAILGSAETTWAGGPCRFALPAGTKVALSALPSSSTTLVPLFFDDYWTGLFNRWTGACTATTSDCTVTMSADRSTRATWGRFTWGLISGAATSTPVFAADGSLSYVVVTVRFVPKENAVTGTVAYSMVADTIVGASATARDTAARAVTACRGPARRVGAVLEARCTPTPALAAALRKGKVRVTTKWYLRAPRQKATYPLGQARAYLANRRAGAVTG
ncbi:MAG: IPT/TIG domain-containing protein, partial [Actinomycetota bacterium]